MVPGSLPAARGLSRHSHLAICRPLPAAGYLSAAAAPGGPCCVAAPWPPPHTACQTYSCSWAWREKRQKWTGARDVSTRSAAWGRYRAGKTAPFPSAAQDSSAMRHVACCDPQPAAGMLAPPPFLLLPPKPKCDHLCLQGGYSKSI